MENQQRVCSTLAIEASSELQRGMQQSQVSWKTRDITWIPPSSHEEGDDNDDRIAPRHQDDDVEEEEEWEEEDYSAPDYDDFNFHNDSDTDASESDEIHSVEDGDETWKPSNNYCSTVNLNLEDEGEDQENEYDEVTDISFSEECSILFASESRQQQQHQADGAILDSTSFGKSMSTLTTSATTNADSQHGSFLLSPSQQELRRLPAGLRECFVSPLADPAPASLRTTQPKPTVKSRSGSSNEHHHQQQRQRSSETKHHHQYIEGDESFNLVSHSSCIASDPSRGSSNASKTLPKSRQKQHRKSQQQSDINHQNPSPPQDMEGNKGFNPTSQQPSSFSSNPSQGSPREAQTSPNPTSQKQYRSHQVVITSTSPPKRYAPRGSIDSTMNAAFATTASAFDSHALEETTTPPKSSPRKQAVRRGSMDNFRGIAAASASDSIVVETGTASTPYRESSRKRAVRRGSMDIIQGISSAPGSSVVELTKSIPHRPSSRQRAVRRDSSQAVAVGADFTVEETANTPRRDSSRKRAVRRASLDNGVDRPTSTATTLRRESSFNGRTSFNAATLKSVRSGSRKLRALQLLAATTNQPSSTPPPRDSLMSPKERRTTTPVRRKSKPSLRRHASADKLTLSSSNYHDDQSPYSRPSTTITTPSMEPPHKCEFKHGKEELPGSPTSRTASFSSEGSSSQGSAAIVSHLRMCRRASTGQTSSFLETVGELPFLGGDEQRHEERQARTHASIGNDQAPSSHSSSAYAYRKPTRTVHVFT
jgi:hypothetical protein